jgi:hypothetical protein
MADETNGFVPVYEPGSGKLLLRFDPTRDKVEIQRRGVKTLIDLQKIKQERDRKDNAPE